MSVVYLVFGSSADVEITLARHRDEKPVDMLVAYTSLREWQRCRHKINLRYWMLDSGAYPAAMRGVKIDNDEFISKALDSDATEVVGLDVLGDPEATKRNLERAWERRLAAIPTFHYGEPESMLKWCAEHAHKIGLGGMANIANAKRVPWVKQCIARVWPKLIHGLGMVAERGLFQVPVDSVDSSSWSAPQRWGLSHFLGKRARATRGKKDIWSEIQWYQRIAERSEWRWRNEMAIVRIPPMDDSPYAPLWAPRQAGHAGTIRWRDKPTE